MTNQEKSTAEWQALDSAHHVHSFTDPKAMAAKGTIVVTRGEGCWIWDSEGNRILDGMAGLWCVNVGYGRRELVEAASRQMEALPYYSNHFQSATPQMIALADKLAELTPGDLDHVFFANSGSEANDTVVRVVRRYWQLQGQPAKQIFIGRTLGYHGSTLAATSLGGMAHMHAMGHSLLPGFAHIPHPHWYLSGTALDRDAFGLECARALEAKILELGAENVAAFIGEPVQGAGGVIDPPATYWPEIQRICRKYDILLVADEVICGFGRTGRWFGSQTYAIQPDVMPMAKGLSSGYLPVAAVAVNDRVFAAINEGGLIAHGYTYSGHPVACAVALANIDIIEREGLVDRVREEIGPYFRTVLGQLADSHANIGELRGVGLMAALELVSDRAIRSPFAAEQAAAIAVREKCLENGLIARAVNQAMVLSPALTISRSEVDQMAERLEKSIDAVADRLIATAGELGTA
ncbi:aspartate aminotransferase family protein [Flavisphingomonas formosensis]|uniref:aspartate aminotransferase family protein n=1 Tax=Flavisphingomonas formosensis TaxID=861534 RepID=UPI0012F9ED4A|nr:aspartate aminotransferase family protein [Sphingomonas formosensis]